MYVAATEEYICVTVTGSGFIIITDDDDWTACYQQQQIFATIIYNIIFNM